MRPLTICLLLTLAAILTPHAARCWNEYRWYSHHASTFVLDSGHEISVSTIWPGHNSRMLVFEIHFKGQLVQEQSQLEGGFEEPTDCFEIAYGKSDKYVALFTRYTGRILMLADLHSNDFKSVFYLQFRNKLDRHIDVTTLTDDSKWNSIASNIVERNPNLYISWGDELQ